jgi:hypothetical protein
MLKGAKNLASYSATKKEPKAVMTLSCLKILGHEIARADWPTPVKSVYWAACTIAFFGSFRMGELLCPTQNSYNSDTLVWSDVTFNSIDSVTLNIHHPKSNRNGGEKVEVFPFPGHNCCPVKALRYLDNNRTNRSQNLPVFALAENEYLCKKTLNDTLKNLLGAHLPGHTLLGHSFRAGIPSALSAVPVNVGISLKSILVLIQKAYFSSKWFVNCIATTFSNIFSSKDRSVPDRRCRILRVVLVGRW